MKSLKSSLSFGLVATAAALSLAACNDHSTPAAVVGHAAEAVVSNDLKTFVSTLTSQALVDYGHANGLAALRARLSNEQPSLGATQLVSTFDCGKTCTQERYNVEILGSVTFTRAEVTCTTTYHQQKKTGFWNKSTSCLIADLI